MSHVKREPVPRRRMERIMSARTERTAAWFDRFLNGEKLSEIGRSEGISRQRVHAMLRQDGYPTFIPQVSVRKSVLSSRSRIWLRILAELDLNIAVGGQDECWPWTGPTHAPNPRYPKYVLPRISAFDPLNAETARATSAYRVVYMLNKGPIPRDMTVDHICWNPLCCNPDHLQLLTLAENSARKDPAKIEARRKAKAVPA